MKKLFQLALALMLAAATPAWAGKTLDRIVVVVDHGVILTSQWEQAVRFEAMVEGKNLSAVSAADRERTLDRLIDQELLEQQFVGTTYQPASAEEIAAKANDLRRQVALNADDAQWQALLRRYGLDESDVRERVAVQLDVLRFVEARFRPSIRIDPRTIDAYYQNTLRPQVEARGAQPPPLKQARPAIEEILVQQRIDDLLGAYLKNLRAQARIRRMDAPKEPEAR
jgi:parvulin-like peptidyl-prolyl isomerase